MNVAQRMAELTGHLACRGNGLAENEAATDCEERFAALVMRQSRFVFRVAYSVLRNVHDAEDAVQETFLKLYRAGTWRRMKDERAFLARTVWRIAIDRLPKRDEPPADVRAICTSVEEAVLSADWNSTIHRLIDALPEELRQPLALSTVEELNSKQIASILGIPAGTVRHRLMRARQMLNQKLAALTAGRHAK